MHVQPIVNPVFRSFCEKTRSTCQRRPTVEFKWTARATNCDKKFFEFLKKTRARAKEDRRWNLNGQHVLLPAKRSWRFICGVKIKSVYKVQSSNLVNNF